MQSFVIQKINKITQNRITPLCLSLNYSTYFFRDTELPRDHLWRLHIHILSQYWFFSLILFGMLSSFLSWIYLSFRDLVSLSFSFFYFFYFFKRDRFVSSRRMLIMEDIKKKKELHLYRYIISYMLIFFFFNEYNWFIRILLNSPYSKLWFLF